MMLPEVNEDGIPHVLHDALYGRIMNRSYMVDPGDHLLKDSRLVRFEDGKLNPKATFTALAAFLDLPYTESLTCCSEFGVQNVSSFEGNAIGFDPVTVYRTYDEYANDAERTLLEYFMRDAYEKYGYDFQYYDGTPLDEARIRELIDGCTVINGLMTESYQAAFLAKERIVAPSLSEEEQKTKADEDTRVEMEAQIQERVSSSRVLLQGLHFVNRKGQPLRFMQKLEPDPALLEQPLYR